MKWTFQKFNINRYDTHYGKAGELAIIEVKIGTKIFLALINKNGGKFKVQHFARDNKKELAGAYWDGVMRWWAEETFKKKILADLHSTESFSFLKSFKDSKDLKHYFEFEKESDNQLTFDVVENVSKEIEELVKEIEWQTSVNIALDNRDRETFMLLTKEEAAQC